VRPDQCQGRWTVVLVTAVASLLVCVGRLAAQDNLLADPGFAGPDLASWPPDFVVQATWQWDPLDRGGSPTSGSGRFENTYTGRGWTVTARQCANGVVGGMALDAGVYVFFPTGQAATGYGWVQLGFYTGADCAGTWIGTLSTSQVSEASPGAWHLSRLTLLAAPDGAASARFYISNSKQSSGGSLVIHFDDAFLVQGLFFDGFESGTTTGWSATTP
jgi:hypothetical protein